MSAVNELVVREYFEMLGFFVTQPRKYVVPGRQKTADEEVDFLISNPAVTEHRMPDGIIWAAEELAGVSRAVVAIRGWHTERFYVSTFEQTPDILRFLEKDALRFAGQLLGSQDMARILCLPRLPASGELKGQTIELLRKKGVDGIISFRTMLWELVQRVDINRNYEKSDLLQIIRLLKNYDLLGDAQLDLFAKKTRRRKKSAPVEPPSINPDAVPSD